MDLLKFVVLVVGIALKLSNYTHLSVMEIVRLRTESQKKIKKWGILSNKQHTDGEIMSNKQKCVYVKQYIYHLY